MLDVAPPSASCETPMHTKVFWAAVTVAAVGLAACEFKAAAPRDEAKPVTIQALMNEHIDPSADAIWEAVGTVVSDKGTLEHAPRTNAEWSSLEAQAQTLVDASARLAKAREAGGDAHSPLADTDVPGTRNAAQITADIHADPARFEAAAGRLNQAAAEVLAAIRGRDKAAIMAAGEKIDAACESCHAAYWYPRQAPAALPDYETFGRVAVNR